METTRPAKPPTLEEAEGELARSLRSYLSDYHPSQEALFMAALDAYVDAKIRRYLHDGGYGA